MKPLEKLLKLISYDDVMRFPPPRISVNYGITGGAYAVFRCGIILKDQTLLDCAARLIDIARKSVTPDGAGFFLPHIGVTESRTGSLSVLHCVLGVTLVEALIASCRRDASAPLGYVQAISELILMNAGHLELVAGRAGLLNGLNLLDAICSSNGEVVSLGNRLAGNMLDEIVRYNSTLSSPVKYLGFAHGWAGILYSLLSWLVRNDRAAIACLLPILEEIRDLGIQTASGTFWPACLEQNTGSSNRSSWCNGSAGFVLLWCKVYEATGEPQWLQLAREAGLHSALHPDFNHSICCGLAGRAIILTMLAQITRDDEWNDHAVKCLAASTRTLKMTIDYPHSLFVGKLGVYLAHIECSHMEECHFPMLA